MNPVRRVHATRKRSHTRRWIVLVSVLILFVTLFAIVYFRYPPKSEPTGFTVFTNHYLTVMKNLNASETKAKIAPQLDPTHNQTDLFAWEQSRLTFAQDTTGWFEDPIEILDSGKGICVQFSIVYVSACLANGYESRLVIAADTSTWNFIHVWAEDYFNGSWVHVDPSDKVWNNPSKYLSWEWGNGIGSNVKIYAFEDGGFEEVTSNYGPHSS